MHPSLSPQARRRLLSCVAAFVLAVVATAIALATTPGPDVTVIDVTDVGNYSPGGPVGGYRAYAIGTNSCNVGNQPVWWCNGNTAFCSDEQHPVIAQNLYRLTNVDHDGSGATPPVPRFEQIGMSWLKHGFFSTNSPNPACNPLQPCASPPHNGEQLGVGCTDTYDSGLNGNRPAGMRSEVNATTGLFPYPYTAVGFSAAPDQRVKVLDSDLDPALHPGALYWAETQYVAADDAAAGNGLNNASYRTVTVGAAPARNISVTGSTVRERTALSAWKAADAGVQLGIADFTSDSSPIVERFETALRATDLGAGDWHYEVAIRNMNSRRAARAYSIAFPPGTTLSNAGVRVTSHHSGEPYTTEDWTIDTSAGNVVTWSTVTHAVNPNANALRWGTTFTFRVDADQPPESRPVHTLSLFLPGTPSTVLLFEQIFHDGFERGIPAAWNGSSP